MPPGEPIVIIGASHAGTSAAAKLRTEGYDGRLVLISAEPDLPYERPPLSKEFLLGAEPALIRSAAFYDERAIDFMAGEHVLSVDSATRRVEMGDGRWMAFEQLLICTGVRNRALVVPGANLEGVFDLRTLRDAERLRTEIRPGRAAVIVGMGFIGAEVAATLRTAGLDVTIIEPLPAPMARVLGHDLGQRIAALHAGHGVEMFFRESVERLEGHDRVERILTSSGRVVECDFAVIGVGVIPNVELLDGSNIAIDNGIVVDEFCRTNVPGVLAAGDVAQHFHPRAGRHVRVEHWQNAIKQGEAAAMNLLGRGVAYDAVHWFWSDQFELNLQYAGFHCTPDQVVVRGSLTDDQFSVFYLEGGRVMSVVSYGQPRVCRYGQQLIASAAEVPAEALADPDSDLRELARTHLPRA